MKLSVSNPASNQISKQAGLAFYDHAMNLLQDLKSTQSEVIQKAAELCAERIASAGSSFFSATVTPADGEETSTGRLSWLCRRW